jgi:energy-coupling factor transporter transmembrane protein EcfT
MAELTLFHYRPGVSLLHILDARVKLVCLTAISIVSMASGVTAMALASFLVISLLFQARLSFFALVVEIRWFFILLLFVFLTRALATPGDPLIGRPPVMVSMQGILSGMMVCWRLLLIVLLGTCITATTRPAHIRQAIQWFLKYIPGMPHHKISTMLGLVIRFIPVILSQSREIADAQRARCIDQRKNPVYRMICQCMSLLRKVFVSADRLALAMASRNYGERPPSIRGRPGVHDGMALALVVLLCTLMFLLK